jgi:hypothetical protein
MLARNELLTNITSGSDMIYKSSIDATIGQSCAQNKAVYRVVVQNSTVIAIPALIPLKALCAYIVSVKWSAISPSGAYTFYDRSDYIIQAVAGGALTQGIITSSPNSITSAGATSTLVYSKNATQDAIDVNMALTGTGSGLTTSVVEFEVFSNRLF